MNCTQNTSFINVLHGFPCNRTQRPPFYSPLFVTIVVPVFSIIICVAIFGSLSACVSILLNKNLRKSATNYFIFSLAFSDLITSSVVMPLDLEQFLHDGRWPYNVILCEVWITSYLLAVPTSIMSLLAISIDRYLTLRDPLNRYRATRLVTRKRAATLLAFLWLYSLLFSFLPLMGWKTSKRTGSLFNGFCVLDAGMAYSFLSSVVNFLLPLIVMCAIYYRIYRIAREMNWLRGMMATEDKFIPTETENPNLPQKTPKHSKRNRKMMQRNLKAAKTISVLVITFFICWAPFTVLSITGILVNTKDYVIPSEVMAWLLLLGYLNCALNPFLYVFHNKKFLEPYRK